MSKQPTKASGKMGRPKTKAKGILFKFKPHLDAFLRKEAKRTGRNMVRILEELLEERRKYKPTQHRS